MRLEINICLFCGFFKFNFFGNISIGLKIEKNSKMEKIIHWKKVDIGKKEKNDIQRFFHVKNDIRRFFHDISSKYPLSIGDIYPRLL